MRNDSFSGGKNTGEIIFTHPRNIEERREGASGQRHQRFFSQKGKPHVIPVKNSAKVTRAFYLSFQIIEMAIERAVTTEIPQTTGETAATTPPILKPETTTPARTTETTTARTTSPSSTPVPTMSTTHSTTVSNVASTTYNDAFSDVNIKPLSVGFGGDYAAESTTKKVKRPFPHSLGNSKFVLNGQTLLQTKGGDLQKLVQGARKEAMQTTRPIATTTPKPIKKSKSSRNSAAAASTLSENDKLLLEAILRQQNSNLSVDELDKIIENQIRLAVS